MSWQTGNNLRNTTLNISVRAAFMSPVICKVRNTNLHAYTKMTPIIESPPST